MIHIVPHSLQVHYRWPGKATFIYGFVSVSGFFQSDILCVDILLRELIVSLVARARCPWKAHQEHIDTVSPDGTYRLCAWNEC